MNNNDLEQTIGIGEYRVFSRNVNDSISVILEGVRSAIYSGIELNPLFDHKKSDKSDIEVSLRFEQPEFYSYKDVVDNDEAIISAIKHHYNHIEYIRKHTLIKPLLKIFGSKEEIIDFCFQMIKNEMGFVNKVFPVSEEDNAESLNALEEKRKEAVDKRCEESRKDRENVSEIERLVAANDMNGLAKLEGEKVLEKRLSGFGLRSGYSWEDIRISYSLDKNQLKLFRMSDEYRQCLANKCIERVRIRNGGYAEKYPDEPIPKVSEWYNRDIIKKAGAIGFSEPDYTNI